MTIPTFADIEAAAGVLAPYNVETPLIENAELSAELGGRLFLKLETLQRTGSFKFRGAMNHISRIPAADRARGVVAFSSGNHAQGVAAAAALLGIPALIVMPKDAPQAKVAGTRDRGAEIVFYDRHGDDREAIARDICESRGATLVRPFDDPFVVAGQGTIGLEIERVARLKGIQLDAVLAPCSGGGLVSGIALALATRSPSTAVMSVEPQAYDGMRRSLAARQRVAAPGGKPSVADALMAPMPGEIPFAIAQQHLRGALAIDDRAMTAAADLALRRLKILVEPSGAAGLAAALTKKIPVAGKCVAVVLSGANCDVAANA